MKRILVPATFLLTAALFSACVDESPKKNRKGFHGTPSPDTQIATNPAPDEGPSSDRPPETKPAPDSKPPPPVPEPPKTSGEIPYAKPVPGKPGFVFSPYEQYKGYIDVRGFPPGTEVKDPYSGKSFLVP
jgi:hypothetical protein